MKRIFNVPNILTMIRILLIPIFVVFYFFWNADQQQTRYLVGALVIVALSGITDFSDGFIARRFDLITDFGKVLDPIADKLTQIAMAVCISITYPQVIPLVVLLFVKELGMLIGVLILVKKKIKLTPAQWYGKFATTTFYVVFVLMILNCIFGVFPDSIIAVAMIVLAAVMIYAFYSYIKLYKALINEKHNNEKEADPSANEKQLEG